MLVLFYTANIYNPLQLSKQWAELFVADAIIMDFVGGLFDLSNPSMKKIEKIQDKRRSYCSRDLCLVQLILHGGFCSWIFQPFFRIFVILTIHNTFAANF